MSSFLPSSNRLTRFVFSLVGLAFLFVGPTGCSKEAKRARHMERAEKFLTAGQYDRAEIEYLNVIQADPKAADAASRLGTIYFEQGRLGRAFEFLSGAVRINEKDPETRAKLAMLLLAVGNRQQATVDASLVLDQKPDQVDSPIVLAESSFTKEMVVAAREKLLSLPASTQESAPVLVGLGILEAKDGKPDEAMKLFERALAKDPKFAAAHAASGAIYASRNEFEKADAALARSVELSGPRSPRGIQYALFKFARGDKPAARKVLEDVLAKAPDYLPATLRLVDLTASDNRLDEAEAMLTGVLKRDPGHPEAMLMSARLAMAKKDTDKAIAQIQVLLRMYPQSPEALFEAGRIYLARAELSKAISSLNQAISINPDYRDAILLLANVNIREKRPNEVVVSLRKLLGKSQPVAGMNAKALEPYFLLAEALRGTGALDEALAIYKKLEAVLPTSDLVALMQGIVLRQMNKPDAARAALELALKHNPDSVNALEQLVELEIADRKPDEAMSRVNQALTARPNSAEIKLLAARMHIFRKEWSIAEGHLRKAIELQPNSGSAYMLLARIYMDKGDGATAIENLKAVVDRNPRDTYAWVMIGSLYEGRKEYEKARDAYEKALAVDGRMVIPMNNLAHLYATHLNQLEKGFELARRARELEPGEPNVADTLGWIVYQKGDYGWALTLLKESAERLKSSPDVNYHLAMAHYMLGDEAAAKSLVEAALRQDPNFNGAADAKARLAILSLDPVNPGAAAQTSLEKHLESNPKDPVALSRLAIIYEKAGNLDKAVETQQKAVESNPQNIRAMIALARMLGAKGDSFKAMEIGRSARKLAPDDPEVAATLGRLAFQAKDYGWAYSLMVEAARARASNVEVQKLFGDAAYSVGRIPEARSGWSAALKLAPDAAVSGRLALVEASLDRSKAMEASSSAEKALTQNPSDVPALMVSAMATSNSVQAIEKLEKVLAIYPDFLPAKRFLAILLARDSKNDARVLQIGTQARDLYPDDVELAKTLGLVSYRLGDYRRAIIVLDGLKARLANDPLYWYLTGMSQAKTNQGAMAIDSLKKALALGLTGGYAEEAKAVLDAAQPKT